jgi:hypothetical protein
MPCVEAGDGRAAGQVRLGARNEARDRVRVVLDDRLDDVRLHRPTLAVRDEERALQLGVVSWNGVRRRPVCMARRQGVLCANLATITWRSAPRPTWRSAPRPTWRARLTTALGDRTRPEVRRTSGRYGGGGNRTRVRGRPGKASTSVGRAWGFARSAGSRPTYRRASHPSVSRLGRLALLRRRARSLMPTPGSRAESGATRWLGV